MMAMMVLSFILLSSCKTNGQSKTQSSNDQAKPPKMDIHAAAFIGDVDAIKAHVKAGTDLNKKDQYGSTPLTITATFNKTKAAMALIEGGADLNVKSGDGSTALHTAAFLCRTDIVKSLLQNGADKSLTNNYGSTALQSVSGPFAEVKPIYEQLNRDLGAFGLKLDYDFLEEHRPVVAQLLK